MQQRASGGGPVAAVVQSLTAEAARVLKQALAEAAKRGHAQATPLHVAACLLLAPNSPLRAACLHVITNNHGNGHGNGHGNHGHGGASMGPAAHPYNNNSNNSNNSNCCDEKAGTRMMMGSMGSMGSGMPRCRALELCFNIALDRLNQAAAAAATPLPTTTTTTTAPASLFLTHTSTNNNNIYVPSYSNALVAALKRAQAHQRRGCPDTLQSQSQSQAHAHAHAHAQAQPPLLAVRVELLQLVVSILDDPSVSRVMREAGFSSTAVKLHLEEEIMATASVNHTVTNIMNSANPTPPPQTQTQSQSHHNQQPLMMMMNHYTPTTTKSSSSNSRNGIATYNYQNAKYGCKEYYMNPAAAPHNLHPLLNTTNNNNNNNDDDDDDALFNNLEHLHRFIPPPPPPPLHHPHHHHRQYGESHNSPVSKYMTISSGGTPMPNHSHRDSHITHINPFMGHIIHQQHEPVSITKHGASSCLTPLRYEGRNNSESLTLSLRRPPSPEQITVHPESSISYTPPELEVEANDLDSRQNSDTSCCSDCTMKYEKEAHLMMLCEEERFYNGHESNSPLSCSSSVEPPTNCTTVVKASPPSDVVQLPSWLQKALSGVGGEKNRVISASIPSAALVIRENKIVSQRLKELQNKWSQACKSLNHNGAHSNNNESNNVIPNLNLSLDLQLQSSSSSCTQVSSINPPPEPILNVQKKSRLNISENPARHQKNGSMDDEDALMRLCKGLQKRVSWQPRVISTLAHTVALCRSGLGVKRGLKGSTGSWLLFLGEDRHGKREMAEALAELVFGEGKKPIYLQFNKPTLISSSSELIFKNAASDLSGTVRGKMPMDSMVEALRTNPSSLVLFEDLDWADSMSRNALLKAMEKGRMVDTNGRDVSFNNAIVIMTSSYPGTTTNSQGGTKHHEVKVEEQSPYGQQESLTMHNKRKGGLSDDLRYGSTTKRPCLNVSSVCLDLNMSAEENITDDTPVTDHHCINSTNGVIKSQFIIPEDESVLRAFANKQHLQGFCDLADAVLVFDPPPV